MARITMGLTVLDCPDPHALAAFYAAVLDWPVTPPPETLEAGPDSPDWVELSGPHGRTLAFQRCEGHRPPDWPSTEVPQQLHLDLNVAPEEMDEAERQVLGLGARLLEGDDGGKRDFRVYADPAGHPFCLCTCP